MPAPKNWNEAKATAMDILGKKAKFPEPKVNLAKIGADFAKADKEYNDAVDVLQNKILALQNMASSVKNMMKQYSDQIARANFGLDAKDDENKKNIEQAQKLLDDYLDEQMDNADVNIKNLDELDKHTMSLSKYETKTSS
jgi:hypothetical protein